MNIFFKFFKWTFSDATALRLMFQPHCACWVASCLLRVQNDDVGDSARDSGQLPADDGLPLHVVHRRRDINLHHHLEVVSVKQLLT